MCKILAILAVLLLTVTAGGQSSSSTTQANALLADYKVNVVAASTTNINLASVTPGVTTIDGVTMAGTTATTARSISRRGWISAATL